MRTHFILFSLLISFCVWFAGCSSPADSKANTVKINGQDVELPFPKLAQGTTGEIVLQQLGKPLEVQSVPSQEGKTEVWIYKFEATHSTTQTATGTRDTPAMSITLSGVGTTNMKDPSYTQSAVRSDITLSLLMFNDRLQAQKAKVEDSVEQR